MMAVAARRYLLFGTLAACGCLLDLFTKAWIFARLGIPPKPPQWWLVLNVLSLTTSLNESALFGIGQGRGTWFIGLSVVAVAGILGWLFFAGAARDRMLTAALGIITGGILGNLYDRLGLPGLKWRAAAHHADGDPVFAVRDWIHLRIPGVIDWPVFNIADSLLVCGALLLLWHTLWADPRRKNRQRATDHTAAAVRVNHV